MVAVLSLISYQHHKCMECGQTDNCIENNSKCLVVSVGYDVILKYNVYIMPVLAAIFEPLSSQKCKLCIL